MHPLALGVVLLFAVSTAGGRMAWGFPEAAFHDSLLGGEDVEVSYVNEDGAEPEYLDASLITGVGIAQESGVEAAEGTDDGSAKEGDEGLVTVPWSPIAPSGTSGRSVTTYTVRDGDTLSTIAAAFSVGVRAIAWSNNIVDPDSIQPGDAIRVPPVNGVLHVVKNGETIGGIAKKYGAEEQRIIAFNGLSANGVLTAGDELVVPDGTPPAPPAPKPPLLRRTTAPQFATSQVPLGYYIAPTTGRNYGRRHSNNGVDIANPCGTPVYAAASGYVSDVNWSGWGGGYGLKIDIQHENGTSTRYAHLSQIIVGSGSVAQGQLIGLMGTTGRSTGCHLHFEVHGARNPLVRY